MRLSGVPAKRARRWSDQATAKPILAGRRGAMATSGSSAVQPPSEPSRGQEAPPSASTIASARCSASPSGVAKRAAPSGARPIQRWRVRSATPCAASRASHARSSGEAFIARGNTRPELPTKVGWPSASHQAISASGGKARMKGARRSRAVP